MLVNIRKNSKMLICKEDFQYKTNEFLPYDIDLGQCPNCWSVRTSYRIFSIDCCFIEYKCGCKISCGWDGKFSIDEKCNH